MYQYYMLKITVQIQENKNKDSCTVKIVNPKDLTKCSDAEKNVGAMVRNKIDQALEELKN